jgi:hypothetical protein
VSKEAVTATLKTRFKNPAARLVLLCLAEHHNGKTGKCCPSVSLIMEETGLSRATVFRALYWLRGIADPNDKEKRKPISAIQWIDWTKASDRNGRQTASDYKLTFLAPGSQIETGGGSHDETEGGSQIETEEGLTHETGEGLIGEPPSPLRGMFIRRPPLQVNGLQRSQQAVNLKGWHRPTFLARMPPARAR